MRFRPCIDIHNGKVKQLVGSSLSDSSASRLQSSSAGRLLGSSARENFVADRDADYYADLYRRDGLTGGHIILLNPAGSPEYREDIRQARLALKAWPGGMQIGGGIRADTAADFLEMGASHVIVTSWVFSGGRILYENLERLVKEVGREKIVLDLSCKKVKDSQGQEEYRIVTDRWQKLTETAVTGETLRELAEFCGEFLIHAVDVEGKCSGIEQELAALLGNNPVRPITYAGGVSDLSDIRLLHQLGAGRIDVTVGSALDLFGGSLSFEAVKEEIRRLD